MSIRHWVRSKLEHKLRVPSMSCAISHLARVGLKPPLILDVGAYRGDFAALALLGWPLTRVVCFEPLSKMAAYIGSRFAKDSRVTLVSALLGARDGDVLTLHEAETASSALDEHHDQGFPATQHQSVALDTALRRLAVDSTDCLIKLDVQGFELQVLMGAELVLRNASAVIVELNLLDIHRGVPIFHELVAWLCERGFVAYDIAGITRRPLDGAVWQIDLVFVPMKSALRTDKRWS